MKIVLFRLCWNSLTLRHLTALFLFFQFIGASPEPTVDPNEFSQTFPDTFLENSTGFSDEVKFFVIARNFCFG